jgi:NTE family protein
MRLLNIAMSQVDALRSRDIMSSVMSKGSGMYIKIGNCASYIAEGFNISPEKAKQLTEVCLSKEDAAKARDYATTLKTPSPDNFELIFRHGYENAKCVHLFGAENY